MVWPGRGARSQAPKAVSRTEGRVRSVAKAGRSVKSVSPFRSRPTVMLKGRLEVAISMGLRRKPPRIANEPLKWTRWGVAKPARPYFGPTLYELEGKVPAPSVARSALPSEYEPFKRFFGLILAVRL